MPSSPHTNFGTRFSFHNLSQILQVHSCKPVNGKAALDTVFRGDGDNTAVPSSV